MTDKPVTLALKELREGAKVGVREMARRLGVSPNSYTHYENPDRFKDPYLPMHMAIRFAEALAPDGVTSEAVLALAGASEGVTAESFDARLAKLPPSRQQQVLQYLADQEALHAQGQQGRAVDKQSEAS
ncbi:MAG: helix-turn-helix transcriptional regulator [Alphaproteobacteria bacterium]|nr:helix-turn-helix transcriptional regulator [Alphaproteobacteria bacterium]